MCQVHLGTRVYMNLVHASIYLCNSSSVPMNKVHAFFKMFLWPRISSWWLFDINLVSLENIFQYESNDINFVQHNQEIVAHFFGQRQNLESACTLFLGTEGVVCKQEWRAWNRNFKKVYVTSWTLVKSCLTT
jgi:hypothetical protein